MVYAEKTLVLELNVGQGNLQRTGDQNVKYVPLKSDYSEIVMKSME